MPIILKKKLSITYKSNHKRSINTKIGKISFTRRWYLIEYDGKSYSGMLFDNYIGTSVKCYTSNEMIKMMVKLSLTNSYEETATSMRKMGYDITKQSVWNMITKFIGDKLLRYEQNSLINYVSQLEEQKYSTNHQVDTLFVEMDGLFLPVYQYNKKYGTKHQKKELRLGKAYIGWEKRKDNSGYKTLGTIYASGFEKPEIFRLILESKINEVYDYYNVNRIVLNGDGARWIFHSFDEDARVICQLDLFHIHQKISFCIKNKSLQKKYNRMVKDKEFESLLEELKVKVENTDGKEKQNFNTLYRYLNNNFKALSRFKDSVEFVELDDEQMKARSLGTIEGSIRNVLSHRMKTCAVWSKRGAKIMAMLLCLYREGRLFETIDYLLTNKIDLPHEDISNLINKNYLALEKKVQGVYNVM